MALVQRCGVDDAKLKRCGGGYTRMRCKEGPCAYCPTVPSLLRLTATGIELCTACIYTGVTPWQSMKVVTAIPSPNGVFLLRSQEPLEPCSWLSDDEIEVTYNVYADSACTSLLDTYTMALRWTIWLEQLTAYPPSWAWRVFCGFGGGSPWYTGLFRSSYTWWGDPGQPVPCNRIFLLWNAQDKTCIYPPAVWGRNGEVTIEPE